MDNDILHGVQVVELGEAEGHGFAITQDFLEAVVEEGNKHAVKVRVNHPEGRGDVLSIVGEASNFYLDGNCVRADVQLFDVPDKSRLMALAQQAGHLFGMSLDFAGELVKQAGSKIKGMTCEAIYAVDFVDCPAATRALFSRGPDTGHWRSVCSLDMAKVDLTNTLETRDMAKDKAVQKIVLEDVPAPYDKAKADGEEVNNTERILSALASMEARLCKLETSRHTDLADEDKKDEADKPDFVKKDDKDGDEKDEKKDDKEEQMATMAAKVCSIMLAKVGVRPRPSKPATEDESATAEHKLSAEDEKIAKALKMDDKERKQFAANIAAANRVKL